MSTDKHFELGMANALTVTKPRAFSWQQMKWETQWIRDYFGLLTRNAICVLKNEDCVGRHAAVHHCQHINKKMQHETGMQLLSQHKKVLKDKSTGKKIKILFVLYFPQSQAEKKENYLPFIVIVI